MTDASTVALVALSLTSSASFIFYGYRTLFTEPPIEEWQRFGMPQMRAFVGRAQLLGAAGVLVGLIFAPLGLAAAIGLCLMMLLGLQVRMKLGDHLYLMLPATSLAIINGVLIALHSIALS